MTPVTEDQVQALLSGLERREKAALRALSLKTAEAVERSDERGVRVMPGQDLPGRTTTKIDGEVVDMAPRRGELGRHIRSKRLLFSSSHARAMSTP